MPGVTLADARPEQRARGGVNAAGTDTRPKRPCGHAAHPAATATPCPKCDGFRASLARLAAAPHGPCTCAACDSTFYGPRCLDCGKARP